jgi:hypothetical protein
MCTQLDGLERHGELVDGVNRRSPAVRAELLAFATPNKWVSPAGRIQRRFLGSAGGPPKATRGSSATELIRWP